jgi:hypothetical protein
VTITASITLDNPSGGAAPFGFTATAYGTTASGEASADTAYQNLDFVWILSTNAVAQSDGETQFIYGTRTADHPTLGYPSRQIGFGPVFSRIIDPVFGGGDVTVTLTLYVSRVVGGVTESVSISTDFTVEDQATAYTSFIAIGRTVAPTAGTGGIRSGATTVANTSFNSIIGTYVNSGGANRCVMLVGGDTFDCTSPTITVTGPCHIRACGTGKPIVSISAGNAIQPTGTCSNLKFSDIDFYGNSSTTNGAFNPTAFTQTNLDFLRCEFRDLGYGFDGFETYFSALPSGFHMQDCNLHDFRSTGGATPPIGFRWCSKYAGIVGNRILMQTNNSTEHPLRTHFLRDSCITNNTIGEATNKEQLSLRSLDCSETRWSLTGDAAATAYNAINENVVDDKNGAGIQTTYSAGGERDERWKYNVIESNYVPSTSGTGSNIWINGDHNVVRNNGYSTAANNMSLGIRAEQAAAPFPVAANNNNVYHNGAYTSSSTTGAVAVNNRGGGAGNVARNNIGYSPNGTSEDFISGTWTESNNSTDAEFQGTNPYAATPTSLAAFALSSGSYARNDGTAVPVYRDALGRWRHETTIDTGPIAFTLGTDPVPASGEEPPPPAGSSPPIARRLIGLTWV